MRWAVEPDGFRLPTEAKWEYACRAGSREPRYGDLADVAWTAADHDAGPYPLGWTPLGRVQGKSAQP